MLLLFGAAVLFRTESVWMPKLSVSQVTPSVQILEQDIAVTLRHSNLSQDTLKTLGATHTENLNLSFCGSTAFELGWQSASGFDDDSWMGWPRGGVMFMPSSAGMLGIFLEAIPPISQTSQVLTGVCHVQDPIPSLP